MTSKAQRDGLVAQLCEFTHATSADAQRLLKAHKWQLPQAMDAFYSDPQAQKNAQKNEAANGPTSPKKLEILFEKYSGKGNDMISIDGTLKYCKDLGVEPEDPVMLAVAELCGAKEVGSFEKKPWMDGWTKVRKDTIESQRSYLPTLRKSMEAPETFRRIYGFAFEFSRNPGQRVLPLDTAIPLWELMLPLAPAQSFSETSAWNFHDDEDVATVSLERWTEYLTNENKNRPISKDVWNQFLDFAYQMDPKYSTFDADEAWPSIIDGFVEHERSRKADGDTEMAT